VPKTKYNYKVLAELISDLTRKCNIKEEYFAASFNLSPTEVRFLKLFAFADSYSSKDLRVKLNLSPGRITHILQSLEGKKLVARITSEKDKRNIIVKLLPKATPLIQNLHNNYNKLHRNILKNVKEDEAKHIYESLQTLLNVFDEWVDQM